MLFYIPNTDIFKYLRDYFCLTKLGLRCIRKEIQNNSSHIVLYQKEHPLSEQGAFLVPVPILKPAFRRFHLDSIQLCFDCEELRSSAVETRKHLRLISQKTALTELGGFFVPFLECSNDISTSPSCFWITAFKHSSSFDF